MQVFRLEALQPTLILEREKAAKELKAAINSEYLMQRSEMMYRHKGKYTFEWKHERKSWQAATAPLYFDSGNGFLFKRVKDNLVQKISIEEFVRVRLMTK